MSADAARAPHHGLPRVPGARGAGLAIRTIIDSVALGRAVLVHCSAGKDRTGWAVAAALRAAGVVEDAIEADYLRSNDAVEDLPTMLVRRYPDADISADYLGVHAEYLRAADETMIAAHGDPRATCLPVASTRTRSGDIGSAWSCDLNHAIFTNRYAVWCAEETDAAVAYLLDCIEVNGPDEHRLVG